MPAQCRSFFAPHGTPTVVPTAFAARAFIEAAYAFKDDEYLKTARSVCDFLLYDLPRIVESDTELCFSYSPNSHTRIFNASLLAAEVLASIAAREAAAGKVIERGTVVNRVALLGDSPLSQRIRFLLEMPIANLFDFLL